MVLLQKSGDGDFLRSLAEAVLQLLMEADVEGLIGAGRHSYTGDRLNYRTAIATAASTRARSSCASPSDGRAPTSRPSWSCARPLRRRWSW